MTDKEKGNVVDIRTVQLKRHAQKLAPLGLVVEVTRFYDPADKLVLNMIYLLTDEAVALERETPKTSILTQLVREFGEQFQRTKENFKPLYLRKELYDQLKKSLETEGFVSFSVPVE